MSDDDAAAERLRTVLRAGAAGVRPADDSLGRILARAHEGRGPRRWLAPLAAVAAVAVVVAGAAVVLGTRGTGQPTGTGSQNPTASLPTASATGASSPAPSASPTVAPAGPVVALPAYYGASFEGKVRLYREFRTSRAADHVQGALQLMLTPPLDADYSRLWPTGTTVDSVARPGGDAVAVTLSHAPLSPADMAVQEVVYTVTAADPSIRTVRVTWPGGGDSGLVARQTSWLVLAPVWILAPIEAATVSSPLKVSGTATVFEATVSWEVDRTDGTKAAAGSTMASIGAPQRGAWSFSVPLPKGTYVVKAWETSMKDGRATWTDTKAVTVR